MLNVLPLVEPLVSSAQLFRWTTYPDIKRNISCRVRAYPPPHFKWFFNGVELKNNATFQIFNEDYVSYLQVGFEFSYSCYSHDNTSYQINLRSMLSIMISFGYLHPVTILQKSPAWPIILLGPLMLK